MADRLGSPPQHAIGDPERLRRTLGPWLAAHLDVDDVEVDEVETPQSSGYSSETVLLRATTARGSESLVVKAEPAAGFTVFPTYDLADQVRVMEVARRVAGVPAAPVRWWEPDPSVLGRPFFVMPRVDGQVPRDNPPYTMDGYPLTEGEVAQRSIWDSTVDVLVALHAVDVDEAGLAFLDWPEFGPRGVHQQIGIWSYYLDWVSAGAGRRFPLLDETLARLRGSAPRAPAPATLSWGDSRIGNVIYADHRPAAVLDWEMATLAPGEADLAWMIWMDWFFWKSFGIPPIAGFGTVDETVSRYEAGAGRVVRDLDWWLLWAGLRFATIMMRITQQMVTAGTAPAEWLDGGHPATSLLEDQR